jgi:hypothetical protein
MPCFVWLFLEMKRQVSNISHQATLLNLECVRNRLLHAFLPIWRFSLVKVARDHPTRKGAASHTAYLGTQDLASF